MADFDAASYCGDDGNDDVLLCSAVSRIDKLAAEIKDLSTFSDDTAYGLDVLFLIFSASLVFFMQAGFAMLCAGSVRQKNVKSIMLKNFLDACGGALAFWSVGYAFAYGGSDSSNTNFIGNTDFFLMNFTEGHEYAGWFFQFAFAATAATIVAGAIAERCQMAAYLCYSVFLTGFVYPVVVHSIWSSSGFLSTSNDQPFRGIGMIDFAGSGVVHTTGGYTALIAAKILGPRLGRFYDGEGNALPKPIQIKAHSVALQMLGTFILWFGWYGFNPGSALVISTSDKADVAALCAVTTTIAAASGAVTAIFTDTLVGHWKSGDAEYDLAYAMNGALSGLVGITSGCAVVTPWASLVIGVVAGWVYCGFSYLLVRLKIDDAVDAVPVHFGGGIWGCLAVGLFSEPYRQALAYSNDKHVGWFYSWGRGSGDANLLLAQFCGILWIIGWVSVTMIPFFLLLNFAKIFRVGLSDEEVGLDISHYKGAAYDFTGTDKPDSEKLSTQKTSATNRKVGHSTESKAQGTEFEA